MIQGGQWRIPDFVRGFIHEICEHTEGTGIVSGGKERVWTASIDGEGTYKSIKRRKPITKWHNIFWFTFGSRIRRSPHIFILLGFIWGTFEKSAENVFVMHLCSMFA